jgi:sulfatase maturation enzyme AslB (radical SAM superfamily)
MIDLLETRAMVVTPANRFRGYRAPYNLFHDFCPLRYDGAHIRMNGAVTPCSFGFAMSDFGNIHERDLAQIWNSPQFSETRRNDQNPICKSCSIFKWRP